MSDDQEKVSDWEWSRRVLCSDGNCIGVVGSDGRCKECGRRYEGQLPDMAESSAGDENDPAAAVGVPDPDVDVEAEAPDTQETDDWSRRQLCSDESCIGVIGPDGRCTECGKKTGAA